MATPDPDARLSLEELKMLQRMAEGLAVYDELSERQADLGLVEQINGAWLLTADGKLRLANGS
jgi:hypothetical protein